MSKKVYYVAPAPPPSWQRTQAVLAIAGVMVLTLIIAVALVRAAAATPSTVPPTIGSEVTDSFGPPVGDQDDTRFYGPVEVLEQLQDGELTPADVRDHTGELFVRTADNIGRPFAELLEEEEAP